ncbi:histidine kinase N-terminal 7TM domain-containing diguanylate cyclase [Psychrobacillus soli]|uniref:Diguanylate cyclase n=1 Tax=Psychrobacillus soli TaxID=1543965 RepID=A0A544T9U4_9BACI|nr:histidine kinase N-terminal 7TM domain-containing protein [Psychrobacillus soli]TQR14233.1 diguanylate cyclase [Psychrobacillus soli]
MYILIVILAGVISFFLCLYAQLKLKEAPGAWSYFLVTLLSTIFTFSYAFELASTSLEQVQFWLRIEYLALPFIPVFVLLMCFEYIGQKLKQWIHYVLFIVPIITIFMLNTNDLHHLYYISMKLSNDGPFPILELEYGPWFYVHSIFVFLCLMIAIIMLLMQLKKSQFRFRMQVLLMAMGLIIPILASCLYLNGLSPYGMDLGPVSMSITFIFHGVALLSFQMFNVAPIARDKVFESMKEGVIVINQNGALVDYNKAILKVIPMLNSHDIGKMLTDILSKERQLAEIIYDGRECDYKICVDDKITYFHISFSSIQNKKNLLLGKIITFADVTERVNMQEKLKQLASMDGLTQVLNRTFFMKKAEIIMDDLAITGGYVSVIMFDIDHFKKVNDTYGHEAGDIVLAHVTSIAKETIRETDVIGRYGGEEFIVCMPNISLHEAYEIADLIREKVFAKRTLINGKEICITSSFGISNAFIEAGDNSLLLQVLIRQADQALYEAKRNGRNRIYMYS